jgi:hypothetical protein
VTTAGIRVIAAVASISGALGWEQNRSSSSLPRFGWLHCQERGFKTTVLTVSMPRVLPVAIVAIILLFSVAARAAVVSCESLDLHPVDSDGNEILHRYYNRSGGVGGLGCWVHEHPNGRDFIITPHSWTRNPAPGKMGLITTTLQAMTDARRTFHELGTFNVQLYFLMNDVHSSAEAYWFHGNQCWMEAGPYGGIGSWREDSRRYFKSQVAHEIGHCFIMENIPGYTPDTYIGSLDQWWDESGAEFLSSIVYPVLNHEHINALGFDLDGQIFTQPYHAYLVFQHYANKKGNRAVIDLFQKIFRQRSEDQLRAYFRNTGFDAFFHDFAVTHYQARISDPGGGYAPRERVITEIHEETLIPPEGRITISGISPSRLNVAKVNIPARYDLTITPPSGGDNRYFKSLVNGNSLIMNWDREAEVVGDCHEPRIIHLLFTHLNDQDLADMTIRYKLEEKEAEECDAPPTPECEMLNGGEELDPCLIGTWELPLESIRQWSGIPFSNKFTGIHQIKFTQNGQLIKTYDVTGTKSSPRKYIFKQNFFIRGNVSACARTRREGNLKFIILTGIVDATTKRLSLHTRKGVKTKEFTKEMFFWPFDKASYTCRERSLSLWNSITYRRVTE